MAISSGLIILQIQCPGRPIHIKLFLFQTTIKYYHNSIIDVASKMYFYCFNLKIFLGTYDVLGVNATILQRNYTDGDVTLILVKCFILKNTKAKGVFSALMYLNENYEIDFYKSHYYPIEKSLVSKGITRNIPRGNYRLLSFDIEEDNRIQNIGCPATTTTVSIDGINNG